MHNNLNIQYIGNSHTYIHTHAHTQTHTHAHKHNAYVLFIDISIPKYVLETKIIWSNNVYFDSTII